MSEQEADARIGKLLRDRAALRLRVEKLGNSLGSLGTKMRELGTHIVPAKEGDLPRGSDVFMLIHELPDEFCADYIRGLVTEYREARGKLLDLDSQLKNYE